MRVQQHPAFEKHSSILWPCQHTDHAHQQCTRLRAPSRSRPANAAAAHPSRRCQAARQPTAEIVVGIDLGTTNSAVAHIVNGKPVCIPNALGDTLTPSVVSFHPGGGTTVGLAAKGQDPCTTYYSVKRIIGRSWADPAVQAERERLAYTVSNTVWDEAGGRGAVEFETAPCC
jgi:hypothetical protein